MTLEVLHVADCPNLPPLLERLRDVTDLTVTVRVVGSDAEAARFGMAGSPTLLVNGTDPFAAAGQRECGMSCRLYRDQTGRIIAAPSVEQLRAAIVAAGESPVDHVWEVLSAWRTRPLPLDPIKKATHQTILHNACHPRPAPATPTPAAPTRSAATSDARRRMP